MDLSNATEEAKDQLECEAGTFLPVWTPVNDVSTGEIVGRGIVYILAMYYLFLGIAYLADLFMESIEMITSTKKEVRVKDDKGREQTVVVRIWNQTVANLTLIALGGAAPEVLLSSIEIVKHNFEAEELGPSESVASASFNLFAIIGVCIFIIPNGQSRRIKHLSVFLVTSVWMLFAYLWLFIITSTISPGIVEIWETVVTLCCLPLTVFSAYLADRHWRIYKYLNKSYQLGFRRGVIVETAFDDEDEVNNSHLKRFIEEEQNEDIREFEDHRRDFILIMKELRRMHPMMDAKQLELTATKELLDRGTKSKAFYKMRASKKLTGLSSWRIRQESSRTDVDFTMYLHHKTPRSSLVPPSRPTSRPASRQSSPSRSQDRRVTEVFFSPGHYTVEENVGVFTATVVRQKGDLSRQVFVDYASEDAGAIAGKDYQAVRGTLCFNPGQTKKNIVVQIIDDQVYEGDQHFYIRLFNLRFGQTGGKPSEKGLVNPDAYLTLPIRSRHTSESSVKNDLDEILNDLNSMSLNANSNSLPDANSNALLRLTCPSLATVMILDDDHHGIFTLAKREISITETVATCGVQILRCGGTRGRVALPYRTEEGTAEPEKDFLHCKGELIFEDGEIEKIVSVPIVEKMLFDKDSVFFFHIGEPKELAYNKNNPPLNIAVGMDSTIIPNISSGVTEAERLEVEGRAQLGEITKTDIRLLESKSFKSSVNKIIKKSKLSIERGTSAWMQKFIDPFHLERDEDYEDEHNGERKPVTWFDYVKQCFTFFWRLLFALIPPTDIAGGYPAFIVCIAFIGLLTAILGDLAYALGCTIGLKIRVTSLAFVSLGTNVPDLLTSRVFAVRSPYADASISNVLGSNAINVYMGVGFAWTMASIYHAIQGDDFRVAPGTVSFMVTLFVCFALVAITMLLLRRRYAGGELGGITSVKIPSSAAFILLWITFVIVNAFEDYGYFTAF